MDFQASLGHEHFIEFCAEKRTEFYLENARMAAVTTAVWGFAAAQRPPVVTTIFPICSLDSMYR
jgi:hypothetical protein